MMQKRGCHGHCSTGRALARERTRCQHTSRRPDEPQHRRLEEAGAGCHRLSQHQQAQDDACWEAPAVALIPRAAFVLFVTTPDSAAFKSSAPLWMLS